MPLAILILIPTKNSSPPRKKEYLFYSLMFENSLNVKKMVYSSYERRKCFKRGEYIKAINNRSTNTHLFPA